MKQKNSASIMNLTRNGIRFNYHGDELIWSWPWKRTNKEKYYSLTYDRGFIDLNDYWYYVGATVEALRKKKIVGYSEQDIFKRWAELTFKYDTVVILRNVNVEMKSTMFWKSVDVNNRKELIKDCPVLFFKDQTEAQHIAESIAPEFAEAYLFIHGELRYHNNETYSKYPGLDSLQDLG